MDERDDKITPVIWTRMQRAARGPEPSLTHEKIARAAIEIADAEGLAGLSMRKVAAKVGAGTMSLYRYVTNKDDDLLDLMVDTVLAENPVPDEPSGDWRFDLAESARRSRRMAHRHPWALPLILGRPSVGPNWMRQTEYGLACVVGLGLPMDRMLDLVTTVSAFTAGYVQTELAGAEAQRRTGLTEEQYRLAAGPWLVEMLATGKYPLLQRFIEEAEDFPDTDEVFERRLAQVISGLADNLPDAAETGRPGRA